MRHTDQAGVVVALEFRPEWRDAVGRARRTLGLWVARARQRRDLAQLDDRLLRDVGISRAAAEREARKPLWQK